MKQEVTKDENELCYANVQETVYDGKSNNKIGRIKMIMARPAFKWTAVAFIGTLVIITVVVTTVLEMTKKEAINGNWENWTSFSDCTHSCSGGTQFRVRSCDNPGPAYDGIWCPGNDTHIQSCNKDPCPVDGGWGKWTYFSTCSKSCGGGTQTRQRECDSPNSEYGGAYCVGNDNEMMSCNTKVCPVHGNWGSWTKISGCSHSCGGGTRYRLRMCNNPSPSFGGNWCSGNATEIQHCKTESCPDYKSAFTVWRPQTGPSSGTIKIVNVITNKGGHYNPSTGQFTCQYPGIYVFSLHILKQPGASNVYCYIRKNSNAVIRVYSQPASSSGYLGSSNSVVLSLTYGDIVDLGSCSSVDTFYVSETITSFSGFLLKAD